MSKADQLVDGLKRYSAVVVAYSGGVDSAVVAAAAYRALGNNATAVTAVSPSLASGELENAQAVAAAIGIRHQVIHTSELDREQYRRNAPDRCFACKSELYETLEAWLAGQPSTIVLNGANQDDLGDYRPGMKAAKQHQVVSPLIDHQLNKDDVREIAQLWELSVWDKPASPCLASRIAYGEEVTREKLQMVDEAEAFLRSFGFRDLRVRYHPDALARIELPRNEISQLFIGDRFDRVHAKLKQIGFRFVTIDMNGLKSGSLVPLDLIDNINLNSGEH